MSEIQGFHNENSCKWPCKWWRYLGRKFRVVKFTKYFLQSRKIYAQDTAPLMCHFLKKKLRKEVSDI